MNINKININQSEPTYYIASDIYDVSYHNSGITFESLSALLSDENLSTLIPTAIRCGGMAIRFVQSSDNKYVQYRLMSDEFSITESDWQGVDDEPIVDSDNLVKSGGVFSSISTETARAKAAEEANTKNIEISNKKLDELENAAVSYDTENATDLDIADENGYVGIRLVDGHIKTSEFDSEASNKKLNALENVVLSYDSENETDLDIADENGYVGIRLVDGHIKTSEFDSEASNKKLNALENVVLSYDSENETDLDIADENGCVGIRLVDGYIKTSEFDSEEFSKRFMIYKDYSRRIFFNVEVNCLNTLNNGYTNEIDINTYRKDKHYIDNAVLYLPKSYTTNGEATKLLIYCKHGNSKIELNSDPVMNSNDKNIFRYMLYIGYAILAVDGVPNDYASEIGLAESVVGNYIAIQSVRRAYEYVIKNYNIFKEGAFIFGFSQGGHYAQNVIDLSGINILAAAEVSPVCSMRYHQWDLNSSGSINGVNFTKLARLNVARLYNYQEVSNDEELLSLEYNQDNVQGYDPWTRNATDVFTGFVQESPYASNLWNLPNNVKLSDITMKKYIKCPLKVWCSKNDYALGVDVTRVFVQAAKNAGCVADIRYYSTGAHAIQTNQESIGTFEENGETVNLYPLAYEIAQWFEFYGGIKNINV